MFVFNILFVIFCATSIQSKGLTKVTCDYNDEACLTKSTDVIFTKIVAGRPGVEPSDPLVIDAIDVQLPNIKYQLRNAKLIGLLNCNVEDVKVALSELAFTYLIFCPKLTIESEYKLVGKLDGVLMEGKGASTVTYDDYRIILTGVYAKSTDEKGLLHTTITKYDLDVRAEGQIVNDYKDLTLGNGEKSEVYVNKLEEVVRKHVMNGFMEKYVQNINSFLKIIPIIDIHYKYV